MKILKNWRYLTNVCFPVILFQFTCLSANGQFETPSSFDGSIYIDSEVILIDLNDDNLDDVVVTSSNIGRMAYWLNEGNNTYSPSLVLIESNARDTKVADMNNDNIPDLVASVVSYTENKIIIFYGLSGGLFSDPIQIANINALSLELKDINTDGLNDILYHNISNGSSTLNCLYNLGNEAFSNSSYTGITTNYHFQIGDLDNDGDMDIVAPKSYLESVFYLRIHYNNGAGVFTEYDSLSVSGYIQSLDIIDLDGDEDNDLLLIDDLTSGSTKINKIINEGDGVFNSSIILHFTSSTEYPTFIRTFDFENDGDIDFIYDTRNTLNSNFGDSVVRMRLNDGSGNFPSLNWKVAGEYGSYTEAACGNLNSDSIPDVFLINSLTNLASVYWGDEIAGEDLFYQFGYNTLLATRIAPIDWDDDGDMDLMCFHEKTVGYNYEPLTGIVACFENDGAGNFSSQNVLEDSAFYIGDFFTVDFDLDGDTDILTSRADNLIQNHWTEIWENQPGDDYAINTLLLNIDSGPHLAVLDIDSDEDFDIISSKSGNIIRGLILNPDNTLDTIINFSTLPGLMLLTSFKQGDLNGDGDMDFAVIYNNGTKVSVIQNNFPGNSSTVNLTQTFTELKELLLADVDTDGDIDILLDNGSTLYWYSNNGGGTFTYMGLLYADDQVPVKGKIILADFDNDLDIDIYSQTNTLKYYTQIAPGSFHLVNTSFVNFSMETYCIIDVDNNNFPDVITVENSTKQLLFQHKSLIDYGCSDPLACNYSEFAITDNNSCIFPAPGDYDCNGLLTLSDLEMLLDNFGCSLNCGEFDIDHNGEVGVSDLILFNGMLGE